MKFLLLTICVLAGVCYGAPREWNNEPINSIEIKNFDLMLALLPIYGGFRLDRMISPMSLTLVKNFFTQNPQHYLSFKTELATEGVHLPELNDINLSAIKPEDYALAKIIVGTRTIKDALEPEFIPYLENYIDENPHLIDLLELRVAEMGIVVDETIDIDRLGDTLVNTFTPMIADFIPTAISIAIFGK